jgi:hypothetical protein
MSEEMQMFINSALGVIAFLGGIVMKVVWDAVDTLRTSLSEMRNDDAQLAAKVQAIEVLVAGQYIKRDEFEKLSQAIFTKLDKIMDKLDAKVDRKECERFHGE